MNENDLSQLPEVSFMDVFNRAAEDGASYGGALLGGAINGLPQVLATVAGGAAHGAEYMGLLSEDAPLNAGDITDASFDWADNVAQDLPVVGGWFSEQMNENPTTAQVGEFIGPAGLIGVGMKAGKAVKPAGEWLTAAGGGDLLKGAYKYLTHPNRKYLKRGTPHIKKAGTALGLGLGGVAAAEGVEQEVRGM